jgi:hypothetical protein
LVSRPDWVRDLEARQLAVWPDRDQLRPDGLFVQVLEDALIEVPCVAVILSPGSLGSRWVQEEVACALVLINGSAPGQRRPIAVVTDGGQ